MKIFVLAHSLERTRAKMKLSLSGLARFVVGHGFTGLEVSDRRFAGVAEDGLRRFAETCRRTGCDLIFDVNADLTAGNDALRAAEIAHCRAMIETASLLQAKALRICIGGQSFSVQRIFRRRRGRPAADPDAAPAAWAAKLVVESWIMRLGHLARENLPARVSRQEEKTARAIESLRPLCDEAGARRLRIGIENHWGVSGDPANVAAIVAAVDSPWIGACPDLGNFPRGSDPVAGLRLLAPLAVIVHAKSYGFRPDGEERRIDYGRLLPIFIDACFDGPVTVEYEGLGDDLAGCRKTRELILRHWPE